MAIPTTIPVDNPSEESDGGDGEELDGLVDGVRGVNPVPEGVVGDGGLRVVDPGVVGDGGDGVMGAEGEG